MSARKWIFGVAAVGVAIAFAFTLLLRSHGKEYQRFSSPDGRFQIVVFRIPMAFAMPGASSDAPGYFQLLDTRTGKVLREQKVEMVQLVDHIAWSATNVEIHLLADWSLPE